MSGMTRLHLAARDGNVDEMAALLEGTDGLTKISINAQNANGQVDTKSKQRCRRCAPATNTGCAVQTPMHLAAKWGKLDAIKFLIEAGADLDIKDRRGRTPAHEANRQIEQANLAPASGKLCMQLDVSRMQAATQTYELKQARWNNDLTETELSDALERLEASGVWSFRQMEKDIEDAQDREAALNAEMERLALYIKVRPQEIKNEIFKERTKMMRKRDKEDERLRLEAKRVQEVEENEARRLTEKRRQDKHEAKELVRERTCGICGQTYTNEKNRGGQCAHTGQWSNWGTNNRGEKVEWLMYWTCCKSKVYEGPAAGHSCCSRSDPHEESHADLVKREKKALKKNLKHT